MMDISESCIIQWFNYIKAMFCARLINCPIQLGGPRIVVQVDEVNIAKKIKHERDHSVQDIFGIYDTATNLDSLGDWSEDTFLKQKIKPGSIIHSDLRKAYEVVSKIES